MASDNTEAPRALRGVLIDPHTRTVEVVQTVADLAAWYQLLGCERVDCIRLGVVPDDDQDVMQDLWIDDDGRSRPWAEQAFFRLRGSEDDALDHPIAGRALLLGSIGPVSVSTGLDAEIVLASVVWLDKQ